MPGERDDRVSRWLKTAGYDLVRANPAHGIAMPDDDDDCAAMVIYGGVQSVNDTSLDYLDGEREVLARWLADDRPILGLCLGGQLIAQVLGARVSHHPEGRHEVGYVPIRPIDNSFMPKSMHQYQWHNEGFEVPDAAQALATGDVYQNQAYRFGSNTYGFQFHPEVTTELVGIWNAEVVAESGKLDAPGADSVEKQLDDSRRYDAAVDDWTQGFLQRWCNGFE